MGCRCFWDPDTDAYAEDTYRNVRAAHRHRTTDPQPADVEALTRRVEPTLSARQDSLFCVAAAFGSYLY